MKSHQVMTICQNRSLSSRQVGFKLLFYKPCLLLQSCWANSMGLYMAHVHPKDSACWCCCFEIVPAFWLSDFSVKNLVQHAMSFASTWAIIKSCFPSEGLVRSFVSRALCLHEEEKSCQLTKWGICASTILYIKSDKTIIYQNMFHTRKKSYQSNLSMVHLATKRERWV